MQHLVRCDFTRGVERGDMVIMMHAAATWDDQAWWPTGQGHPPITDLGSGAEGQKEARKTQTDREKERERGKAQRGLSL